MANQATAYGLRPIGLVGSGVNSTGVTEYEIASDNANAIFQYGIVYPYIVPVLIDSCRGYSGRHCRRIGCPDGC
jgi:hypothetical protein